MRLFLKRQTDIVEAVHETMLAEFINFKAEREFIAARDNLFFKVNLDRRAGIFLGFLHQCVNLFLRQDNRQNTVLETVAVENIGIAGGYDTANTEVQQSPRRMLAGGAAAEIRAGD
jgi:hypothetical protein